MRGELGSLVAFVSVQEEGLYTVVGTFSEAVLTLQCTLESCLKQKKQWEGEISGQEKVL